MTLQLNLYVGLMFQGLDTTTNGTISEDFRKASCMCYLFYWGYWNVIAIALIYGDSIVKATLFKTGFGVRMHNS